MFVGCSEISISVTVKHVQNNGLISRLFVYLGELAKFFSVWGPEKIAGLWFAFGEGGGGISTQADTMWIFLLLLN